MFDCPPGISAFFDCRSLKFTRGGRAAPVRFDLSAIDGLAGLVVLGDPYALLAQPGLQRDDERPAALMACIRALLRRQAVDLALDCK
jgi:hypothetical protein